MTCLIIDDNAQLSTSDFIRTHRSYLIALNKIDVIQDGAVVVAGKSIPGGRRLPENIE